jgi:hypothetical protein
MIAKTTKNGFEPTTGGLVDFMLSCRDQVIRTCCSTKHKCNKLLKEMKRSGIQPDQLEMICRWIQNDNDEGFVKQKKRRDQRISMELSSANEIHQI